MLRWFGWTLTSESFRESVLPFRPDRSVGLIWSPSDSNVLKGWECITYTKHSEWCRHYFLFCPSIPVNILSILLGVNCALRQNYLVIERMYKIIPHLRSLWIWHLEPFFSRCPVHCMGWIICVPFTDKLPHPWVPQKVEEACLLWTVQVQSWPHNLIFPYSCLEFWLISSFSGPFLDCTHQGTLNYALT